MQYKLIRAKYTAKWDVQIAGMIFQTGSNAVQINFQHYLRNILKIYCVRVSIT